MGRHREFDVDKALDAALCVFWRNGYEGASYADLTAATGVERPALYSAFGNKEALFRRALARYYDRYLDYFPASLALPTSREVVAHLFSHAADLNTRYPTHTGCFLINGALAGSEDSDAVREMLIDMRAASAAQLRERLERAKAEGDLPATASSEALTAYVMAVLHGMAVLAKAGSPRETLEAVAAQALASWPEGKSGSSGT
ncbi:TetR/AcrR family transcriptional regulator [Methylobrevis pamukkalensis]|uniref:HTH-type transcriptional repressor ComR n=1 Tax=Methylobrevis pamukkalensis TaxID=1439726 RepID=A0A1E3H428_9HYPH|nr:TetR/AcrR family transcriptional regulator [Methylobrevis pamukkalensis]ODN71054.1 HTH-type transcriptional repressor ComR [Methylobrevis pamukkalensis]